jgi:hypothetical protein
MTTPNDEKWLLSKIPSPVVDALLIYKGSRDGWTKSKFHELCDRMGPTLTIMKTKAGAICGGFTVKWERKLSSVSLSDYRRDHRILYVETVHHLLFILFADLTYN